MKKNKFKSKIVKLDLGCGLAKKKGYVGLDSVKLPGVDIVADLNKKLPIEDSSVDEVLARFVLEHVDNIFFTMEEIHRILKPGGKLTAFIPYWNSYYTFADLQHTRGYVENSFDCFTEDGAREYSSLNYYTKARYRIDRLELEGGRLYWMLRLVGLDGIAKRYLNNIVSTIHLEMRAIKKG
ncbi:MAG: class I SAM-dependent methyltransferase [Candidatus Micrarchaeota archaeon]